MSLQIGFVICWMVSIDFNLFFFWNLIEWSCGCFKCEIDPCTPIFYAISSHASCCAGSIYFCQRQSATSDAAPIFFSHPGTIFNFSYWFILMACSNSDFLPFLYNLIYLVWYRALFVFFIKIKNEGRKKDSGPGHAGAPLLGVEFEGANRKLMCGQNTENVEYRNILYTK